MRTLWALALSFLLCAAAPAQAQLQPVPPLTGHLVDGAGMLDTAQQAKLEAILADYEARTGSQIAVLTVKTTEPEAIEQFSIRVVEAWKLGRKGVDDGVLLMVAPGNPTALRRLRIEAGRGVQGSLTDAQSKRVLQDVIAPHFRDKNYYEGLVAGVGALATLLNKEQFPPPVQAPAASQSGGGGFPIGILFALAVGFMVLRGVFGGRGRGASLGRGGWGSGATGFVIGSILSNAGRGGGGLGGGGFGGGGGFSGGGGSFDGGGASGDW